tara:strand:+ start:624 stop:1163 length:540 start_codon:yes stop_codon:yes gene_type:complete
MTDECFEILTRQQGLVENWDTSLALAIKAETQIRNLISINKRLGENEIRSIIVGICVELEIRREIEECSGRGIISDSVWSDLSSMYHHQNMYREERVEYSGSRNFPRIEANGDSRCEWPGCEIREGLEKDHKIPRSVLTDDMQSNGGRDWEKNGQWLCSFHNRLKTDSILIGVLMLGSD